MSFPISQRAQRIDPFYVMQVAEQARALAERLGPDGPRMLYLNIGEPDFTAAPLVQAAAERAIAAGQTQYTAALGLWPLRERIAAWYGQRFGLEVSPRRIAVTAGASAALQLACLALFDAGDEVLMPDPSYPCNRHILSAIGARAVLLPTTAAQRFQLDAAAVARAWGPATRGVLLASPSNPTGTSIDPAELAGIHAQVQARGGVTLVDEIYLGLSHDDRYAQSALALGQDVVSVNSFSKYFHMTGWRLGWLVLPEALLPAVERLAQNLYICASTVAQHAALACFESDSLALCEERRVAFRRRRDAFVPALQALGFEVPVAPDGAFYVWADASPFFARLGVDDSAGFVQAVMQRAQVVLTPSRDFSDRDSGRFVRFSTASSDADLQEAVERLRRLLLA
jgi:aspartate/methionine/tyrosine aminotransferase